MIVEVKEYKPLEHYVCRTWEDFRNKINKQKKLTREEMLFLLQFGE